MEFTKYSKPFYDFNLTEEEIKAIQTTVKVLEKLDKSYIGDQAIAQFTQRLIYENINKESLEQIFEHWIEGQDITLYEQDNRKDYIYTDDITYPYSNCEILLEGIINAANQIEDEDEED